MCFVCTFGPAENNLKHGNRNNGDISSFGRFWGGFCHLRPEARNNGWMGSFRFPLFYVRYGFKLERREKGEKDLARIGKLLCGRVRRVFNKASSSSVQCSTMFCILSIHYTETEAETETHAALCRVGQLERRAISQFLIYLLARNTPYIRVRTNAV